MLIQNVKKMTFTLCHAHKQRTAWSRSSGGLNGGRGGSCKNKQQGCVVGWEWDLSSLGTAELWGHKKKRGNLSFNEPNGYKSLLLLLFTSSCLVLFLWLPPPWLTPPLFCFIHFLCTVLFVLLFDLACLRIALFSPVLWASRAFNVGGGTRLCCINCYCLQAIKCVQRYGTWKHSKLYRIQI